MHATGQDNVACGKIEDVLEGLKQEEPGRAGEQPVRSYRVVTP